MECKLSKVIFDVEWFHQLLREAEGINAPADNYSEKHRLAERMAAVVEQRRIKPFLAEVESLWQAHPDWRFGQMVSILSGKDPFYIEDDEMLGWIQRCKEQHG